MGHSFETAQLIGTAYVCGLALLGVILLIRGRSGRSEVGGTAFASALCDLIPTGSDNH